jgi:hypothetical protein
MSKNKIEYGILTPEQAAQVWAETLNPACMIKSIVKPVKLDSTNTLSAPEMWPKLANLLLMRGLPDSAQLDFEGAAKFFNEIIKKASAGAVPAPRALTAGDFRKVAIKVTRQRLAEASIELAQQPNNADAQVKQKEAKEILTKHGWSEVQSKRKKKAKAGKAAKQNGTGEHTPVPASTSAPIPAQIPASKSAPVASAPALIQSPKSASESTLVQGRVYYARGFGKPVEKELLQMGGQFNKGKRQWYFPTPELGDAAEKIMKDYSAAHPSK